VIALHFPDSSCILQIIHDPDEDMVEIADTLVLSIVTERDPCDALDRLTALEREWWPTVHMQDRGKLCLNLTYK